MRNPTGEQYAIGHGEHTAVVTEVGATLRTYAVAGREVVKGFAVDAVIKGGRGQHLLPWPNRIRDGLYTFADVLQQLVLSEPKRHNAIHGLTRHVAWTLLEHADSSVRQRVRVYPQPGWPGVVEAEVTHQVGPDGLTVDVLATNVGVGSVPFGYACHPYLTVGESTVDEVTLTVPAARVLRVDDRMLPAGLDPVTGTDLDFTTGRLVGSQRLDTAYTGLERDSDGRLRVSLARDGRRTELWADASFGWVQVFTGDDLRDVGIAVEPMTCGPDAFNPGPTHDGMLTLEPGESFRAQWGVCET